MKSINFTHHSYLVEGRGQKLKDELFKHLEEKGVGPHGNPDFLYEEVETLSIDKTRAINEFHSRRSVKGGKKIIIITFTFATREAQNSLLKTLEEPKGETHFILLVPSKEILLPTIRSRVQVVSTNKYRETSDINIDKFITLPPAKRLEELEDIIKEKDKTRALNFIKALLNKVSKRNKADTTNYLETLIDSIMYLNDRAPNVKQILEYTALNLPKSITNS